MAVNQNDLQNNVSLCVLIFSVARIIVVIVRKFIFVIHIIIIKNIRIWYCESVYSIHVVQAW